MPEAFIGEIKMFGGNFAPRDWAFCNGQLLPISEHDALFSLLGTTYGGDGRTDFALPDLRGRVPLHAGGSGGPGLHRYREGQKGGRETVTLTENQMPTHQHTYTSGSGSNLRIYNDVGNQPKVNENTKSIAISGINDSRAGLVPTGNAFSTNAPNTTVPNTIQNSASSTQSSGGGQSVDNIQPYLAINYIISLQGVFPPRS